MFQWRKKVSEQKSSDKNVVIYKIPFQFDFHHLPEVQWACCKWIAINFSIKKFESQPAQVQFNTNWIDNIFHSGQICHLYPVVYVRAPFYRNIAQSQSGAKHTKWKYINHISNRISFRHQFTPLQFAIFLVSFSAWCVIGCVLRWQMRNNSCDKANIPPNMYFGTVKSLVVIFPLVDVCVRCKRAEHIQWVLFVVNNLVSCSMINEHTECNYKIHFIMFDLWTEYLMILFESSQSIVEVWTGAGFSGCVGAVCCRFSMFHRIIIISLCTHFYNSCHFIHMLWLIRAFDITTIFMHEFRRRRMYETMHLLHANVHTFHGYRSTAREISGIFYLTRRMKEPRRIIQY